MRQQIRLGTIAGIEIRMHWTFALLPLLFALVFGLTGLCIVLFVFACVTAHELCHSLQAQRFGIQVQSITLYPFGGVARLESFGHGPREEFITSMVGPLFNFALAAVLFLPLYVGLGHEILFDGQGIFTLASWRHALAYCLWINVILGLFNLIPAFPMDGGRMLRALLAERVGFVRATRVALTVGRVCMVGFIIWGVLKLNVMLLVIAGFLYMAGGQEAAQMKIQSAWANRHRPT